MPGLRRCQRLSVAPAHLPYLSSRLCLTDAMEAMRDEASYCVSRCSLMVHKELSTLATLPLASAKARRVSSTSGVEQQLETKRKNVSLLKDVRKSRQPHAHVTDHH